LQCVIDVPRADAQAREHAPEVGSVSMEYLAKRRGGDA
jgi:hypothetical protein